MSIEEYVKIDPSFNQSRFIGDINRMMQKIYEAVSNDNLDSIKYFISDKVYERYQGIINRSKEKGLTLKYENVFVDSEIKEISKSTITVESTCRYSKYYTKDGKIMDEGKFDRVETTYTVTATKDDNALIYYCCEGCGKSFNATTEKRCPHCGREIIEEIFDYIIMDMWG